jgi:parallel beta-helix repeat protein
MRSRPSRRIRWRRDLGGTVRVSLAVAWLAPAVAGAQDSGFRDDPADTATGPSAWSVVEPFELQETVDAAAYGDTVYVGPGTYGAVTLRSGILLLAEAGPDETVLEHGRFWCVKADGVDSTAVLEGFTLDGAKSAEGAVTADNSYFTVRDCVLRNAWSGVRAMYSDLRVENCTIRDCQNGIYLFESGGVLRDNDVRNCINGMNLVSSSPRVLRNEIVGNSVGISLSEHSDPRIGGSLATSNRIRDNRAGNVLNRALEKRFSVRTMKPMTLKVPYNYWGADCPDSLWFRGPVIWSPWVDESGTHSLEDCPSESRE